MNKPIDTSHLPIAAQSASPPGLAEIFLAFSKTGLISIGGGLTAWMMRDFVENRRWVSEQEFLSGLALAQAFPGVNVVNLSIWVGFHLRGGPGALVAALGMIVGPMVMAIAVVSLFDQLARYHIVAALIAGAAAAAIGLSLSMGLRAARSSVMQIIPALVIVAIVVALAVLRWPLLPVILAIAPLSVGLSFWRLHAKRGRS